jgi:protein-disulfide isomerase-like protein with CxxC motif
MLSDGILRVMVAVSYYTDPLCPWSWAAEPVVRKLMVEFGDGLRWTFLMAGLERDLLEGRRPGGAGMPAEQVTRRTTEWLKIAGSQGVPLDPLLWTDNPPISSQPACMGVKAAARLSDDSGYRYLRAAREALICRRIKLDNAEALKQVANATGVDAARFDLELRSHDTTEALGTDLELTRELAGGGHTAEHASDAGGAPLPTIVFSGDDRVGHGVFGLQPLAAYREAATAAGAQSTGSATLTIDQALDRFGTLTRAELELLCDLPGPRANAELWRLAEQWKAKAERCGTEYLWSRP